MQRPWYTAAWAASLHIVWYYLSFSQASILSKCCTAGIVIVATDYAVQWYHRRSQRVRALLPPLLAQTIRRENGLNTPSVVPHLMAPRTYAQLSELLNQASHLAVAVKDQILEWRSQHTDVFSGCAAAGCFVLGVLLNRVSGAFLLYMLVVVVLVLPILERVPEVRTLSVQIQPARIAEFLATHAAPSPQHEEEVQHLAERLPPASAVLQTVLTPTLTRDREHDALLKADLAEYFKEEDLIEQLQAARARRSAGRVDPDTEGGASTGAGESAGASGAGAGVEETVETGASAAAADALATSGLRRRNTTGVRDETDDDGFSMVSHSEAN